MKKYTEDSLYGLFPSLRTMVGTVATRLHADPSFSEGYLEYIGKSSTRYDIATWTWKGLRLGSWMFQFVYDPDDHTFSMGVVDPDLRESSPYDDFKTEIIPENVEAALDWLCSKVHFDSGLTQAPPVLESPIMSSH